MTVLLVIVGVLGLIIALAVWTMLRAYGWLASDPKFWVHVFGG